MIHNLSTGFGFARQVLHPVVEVAGTNLFLQYEEQRY